MGEEGEVRKRKSNNRRKKIGGREKIRSCEVAERG